MTQNILSQLENISNSLNWIKINHPSDYEQKFLQLIEEKRKLIKIKSALLDNPAIAAYGVSQVGKSYLMNCILQKNGEPFLVRANNKEYKFIEEMNPKTDNTEATGVVTRFSSFSRDTNKYSEEYPILMKCLTVTDVILILSDGYYNDISDFTSYSEKEISDFAEGILTEYKDSPIVTSTPIAPESILDIKLYYKNHIRNAQTFLNTTFFDQLSRVIDRIPPEKWVDVFSILWHKSEYQTKLFTKLLTTLGKLKYSQYIYLPAEALLHDGINENTVMSVQCLNELFLQQPRYFTDVFLRRNNSYEKVSSLTKSEVCAVCAEIVVKIDEKYLENTSQYSFCNITDEKVMAELSKDRVRIEKFNKETSQIDITYETSVEVLKKNDLLDFPGARSRKKELHDTLKEDLILINVLLRGKVAYLFNQYNESRLINVLLYCHHAAQNDVTDIPLLLRNWIMNYVGDTINKRKETLNLTGGISPLFYIGTKFNMDMQKKTEDIENGINALNGRWQQRFEKVLYHQCFNADGSLDHEGEKIFLNWTKKGETFSNCYILRDFKFSGPLASKLYEDENTEKRKMTIPEEHYKNMRDTFCTNNAVRRFFAFPELSWDACASIDNDGAQYIISQLSKVSDKTEITRSAMFESMINDSIRTMLSVMEGYYVPTDVGALLKKNIAIANSIFQEMDFTCNSDNYYFGHLIQALQIKETMCYKIVHSLIQSPEMNDKANDFKDYEIIRNSCERLGNSLSSAKNEDDKWECLLRTYGFISRNEAEAFLTKKGVSISKLFDSSYLRKMNSNILSDAVYDSWCSQIKSVNFLNEFSSSNSFSSEVMTKLVDNFIVAANALHLRDKMAEAIAEYVNVVNIYTINEPFISDILASIINDFILDFGYSYIEHSDIEKVKNICASKNISAFKYIEKDRFKILDEEKLTEMFDNLSDSKNKNQMLPSFDDSYNRWIEYMFISFMAHLDIPDFDHEANEALLGILNKIKCS